VEYIQVKVGRDVAVKKACLREEVAKAVKKACLREEEAKAKINTHRLARRRTSEFTALQRISGERQFGALRRWLALRLRDS
jgi:hypothetical protein